MDQVRIVLQMVENQKNFLWKNHDRACQSLYSEVPPPRVAAIFNRIHTPKVTDDCGDTSFGFDQVQPSIGVNEVVCWTEFETPFTALTDSRVVSYIGAETVRAPPSRPIRGAPITSCWFHRRERVGAGQRGSFWMFCTTGGNHGLSVWTPRKGSRGGV